jgi:uncharacterized membrane protein
MKNVKLSKLWDSLHSSYWFIPTLMAVGSMILAIAVYSLSTLSNYLANSDISLPEQTITWWGGLLAFNP